jgi:hypothetical protein
MRSAYSVAALMMMTSMSSAAYLFEYQYSSDDCSGDVLPGYPYCTHEGVCDNEVPLATIYMCDPSLKIYTAYRYENQGGAKLRWWIIGQDYRHAICEMSTPRRWPWDIPDHLQHHQ